MVWTIADGLMVLSQIRGLPSIMQLAPVPEMRITMC